MNLEALRNGGATRTGRRLWQRSLLSSAYRRSVREPDSLFLEHYPPSDYQPILVFGAGWRCGSTAVQRLISSSPSAHIWGEALLGLGLAPGLRQVAARSCAQAAVFPQRFSDEGRLAPTSGKWVATTYPCIDSTLRGMASHVASTLGDRHKPGSAWGSKEVALHPSDVAFFVQLFPRARVVFLIRDPFKAYASFSETINSAPVTTASGRIQWVTSPAGFGRHWARLASFMRVEATRSGALILRYENIIEDEKFVRRLGEHVQQPLDPREWRIRVGTANLSQPKRRGIAALLEAQLRNAVGDEAARWDYR